MYKIPILSLTEDCERHKAEDTGQASVCLGHDGIRKLVFMQIQKMHCV